MTHTKQKKEPSGLLRALRGIGLAGLLIAVLSVNHGFAQEFRASITGQVADPTGAVVPNATVSAVNDQTHLTYSTKSGSQGQYSLLYLLPGEYTVTVEAASFQSMVYNNVELDSSQQLGLNVTLKPGAITTQVTVTAGPVDLDTVSASTGGVIDQAKVQDMPSSGMMVWADLHFTEGIRTDPVSSFNLTPRNNGEPYSVAGAQTDENVFYMNGAPISYQGSWNFSPNTNSVAQVQASVMPYDAQYGQTGAGVFSANVKDGTNAYHGAIWDYYGNEALDANSWSADLAGLPKSVNIRNTFGGESGGPIRRNKTFYFGSYEGFRQHQPFVTQDSVPLPDEVKGNFASSGYTVYDPTSTYCAQKNTSGACTAYARNAFPNDQITTGISPIGQAILALYPAPNEPGVTNNYVVRQSTTFRYDQYIGRIDQSFSENTRMYGLFTLENDGEVSGGNGFTNEAVTSSTPTARDYNIILDLTHIFSASRVVDLKASYGHDNSETISGVAVQDNYLATKLGLTMPAVATTPHQNIVPTFSVSNGTTLFGNTANGSENASADFAGSMTQTLGRHILHYGVEFMDIQTAPTGVLGNPNGSFSFDQTYTQGNPQKSVTGQGNSFADILLGYPTSGSVSWNEPTFVTVHYFAGFAQDDFNVRPNLTLNLGLRWDFNTSPKDRHDRINAGFCFTCANPLAGQVNLSKVPSGVTVAPLVGGLQFAGVNGVAGAPFQVSWNHWQPRVGFSWAALRNTVVRGGFGIFYPWEALAVDDMGFSQTTPFVASLNGGLNPGTYFNSGTPYPSGAIAPTGSSLGLATNAGNSISYNDTNRVLRQTQHWSLGIQRRMPWAVLLDVEYLGTHTLHIPVTTSLGVISTAQQQACLAGGAVCNNPVANPFYGVLPSNSTLGASATLPEYELMRAYPMFNGVSEQRIPSGSSHFNALAVRVERRKADVDFVFNYTYSNWIDIDSYLNNGNFRDATLWKGLDGNDDRNQLNTDVVYPLPGIHQNRLLNGIVNGWVADSSFQWETGVPMSLPSANFNWGTPGCTSYAPVGGQTRAHWFNNNQSCWTQLTSWEPRTTPLSVGFLRNEGSWLWNPAFHKQFTIRPEKMFAQFRMEAYNGANHPHFGGANTSVGTQTAFTPQTSWTGFGTLPTSSNEAQRVILASLKILF